MTRGRNKQESQCATQRYANTCTVSAHAIIASTVVLHCKTKVKSTLYRLEGNVTIFTVIVSFIKLLYLGRDVPTVSLRLDSSTFTESDALTVSLSKGHRKLKDACRGIVHRNDFSRSTTGHLSAYSCPNR